MWILVRSLRRAKGRKGMVGLTITYLEAGEVGVGIKKIVGEVGIEGVGEA
jgi:hypothetical protein